MYDPFPEDFMEIEFNIPNIDEEIGLVYNEKRYVEGNSPNALYIPNKLVMFKLMRACLDIYNEKYSI